MALQANEVHAVKSIGAIELCSYKINSKFSNDKVTSGLAR